MAWIYHSQQFSRGATGFNPSGQAHVGFYLKTRLVQLGWTVMSSGDGLSYFAATDGITHDLTGAGGFGNANAWFRIRQPSGGTAPFTGTRELVIHNQVPLAARYSKSGDFTGGGPSATVSPTAADEQDITGGLFTSPANSAIRIGLHFKGDNDGTNGFSWALFFYGGPEGAIDSTKINVICMDAMKVGSFPYGSALVQDNDPYVFRLHGSTLGTVCRGWRRNGLASSSWKTDFRAMGIKAEPDAFPYLPAPGRGLAKNFTNGLYNTLPVMYCGDDGWKGVSTLFKTTAVAASGIFPLSDKLSVNYLGVGISVAPLLITPWDTTVRIYA